MMTKSCLALAFFCFILALPVRAFNWETATSNGREYVSLHSFCLFYNFDYQTPSGNGRFNSRNSAGHMLSLKLGSPDMYLDGVHYLLSFPVEGGDRDWLVSRMDVIKLFEPVLRPSEISGRHSIRGVVIDAGHGGTDNGAGSRFGNEKTYTLDTAGRLAKILNDAGLKTVFTRRTDVFVDLYERAHIASLYPDYCFVSIHYNSAMEEARGLETYCLAPRGAASTSSTYLTRGDIQKLPGNDYDTQNILLASLVHSEIIKLNPGDATADRGVKRARFVVIKANSIPAILVEGGFVSNHMEAVRVNRPDYRQQLAQAIARGVIRFVNAEGDRHLSLPDAGPGLSTAAEVPVAKPAVPPAPAGLARDPGNGGIKAAGGVVTTGSTNPPSSQNRSSRKDKTKKPAGTVVRPSTKAVTPAKVSAPENANATTLNPARSNLSPAENKAAGALNLSEPVAPAPTPGADAAPPEPDEPPTVKASDSETKTPAKASPPATNASSASAGPTEP